uniref:Uncharacterized protein n=1 Tax=Rousettus aegyptiacus TaxID=9407 RepID=A0A7J8H163_ROUAE|nr:hypothetical protein HJG63_011372 [Rousettus aegyptiacus]
MPRRYSNPRKESRALGAVQIIVGLFHFALGILCSQLFLEDGNAGIGSLPVLIVLTYAFCSTPFFITSGSVSVETQRKPTHHKLAGSMLLQFLLFSAITELVITNIVIDWFVTAVTQVPNDEEGLSLSNYSGSS